MAPFVRAQDVQKIAVVGGGYVGHGVAQQFAQAGFAVAMYNRTEESSARAMEAIGKGLALLAGAGALSRGEAEAARARVRPTTDLAGCVAEAGFVVEAVAEQLPVKQELFRRLESLASESAIFASETSGLRISDIARGTRRPERCIATHNYTPPPLIPVVEVVPGDRTAPEVIEATCALLRRAGKEPVICREVPGHIGTRLTTALRREAYYIVEQGYATPEAVDAVLRSVGRLIPVLGILAMTDFSGIDVLRDVHRNIQPHLDHRPDPSPMLDRLIEEGRLGIKSGRGFYRWTPEKIQELFEARGLELIRGMRQSPPPLPPAL
ncbi:MAG: 3-hydroxyacyl-CoA dehydrogenase family protein [Candidatus Tectomicrobia bacterium]|uniref:3-hydroxyacyl-CoA dehydrogenase family protein n=1 Tax=Tectimicrobiota bacterium TaxID=2528274 RepID=A0A932HZV3_UNCTE|nr:3-hydroxyacyl-CoA dehydrogenase family protein [Candidatus Tectomicrobia bacterium]